MVQFQLQRIRNHSKFFVDILPLSAFLLFGFFTGAGYARTVSFLFLPYLNAAITHNFSFFGFTFAHALPLVLSILIVRFRRIYFLYILAAFKAFSFSFCLCAIGYCFGSAGWLIRFLLLFSDSCILPCLIWLWLRCFSRKCIAFKKDLTACIGITVLVGFIDYFVISPFLLSVFNY